MSIRIVVLTVVMLFSFMASAALAQESLPSQSCEYYTRFGGDIRFAQVINDPRNPGVPLNARAQSGINSQELFEIPAGQGFEVNLSVDPICDDRFIWRQATYQGDSFWFAEADILWRVYIVRPMVGSDLMNLTPYLGERYVCDDDLVPAILEPGIEGRATLSPPRIKLRSSAGFPQENNDGNVIGRLDPGTPFVVLPQEEPVCADGFRWWHVQVGDLVGWLADGDELRYSLEPIGEIATEAQALPGVQNPTAGRFYLTLADGVQTLPVYPVRDATASPVGFLELGSIYQLVRSEGGWAFIAAGDGTNGWVDITRILIGDHSLAAG